MNVNAPACKVTIRKEALQSWLNTVVFSNWGDTLERQYSSYLATDFPRNEIFWRSFVVPLTNRIEGAGVKAEIHFRQGVDPVLQYICGANYSLFTHLAFSKMLLGRWNDTSLSAIYTRLASALDVFEALAIKFYLLICECRGTASPLLRELNKDEFLRYAGDYYDKNYPTLQEYYLKVGKKPPPILIPTKGEILDEYL